MRGHSVGKTVLLTLQREKIEGSQGVGGSAVAQADAEE